MNNYKVLQDALDKATQRGVFSLQEIGFIMASLKGVHGDLKELEQYRGTAEQFKEEDKNTPLEEVLKQEPKAKK